MVTVTEVVPGQTKENSFVSTEIVQKQPLVCAGITKGEQYPGSVKPGL